ncbi:MAG TPA: alpha/beta fold hydrolase, partial [Steroidobacteraceae bacterium]
MAFFCDKKKSSLHYLVRGHGKPLLLIHGLGGSGADWAFQVAALEKRFRVIIPDLPGSGHSPPPRDGYTIQGFAATLWSLLDHLGVERTNIIGFSLGGAVALEMAARRPSRVPRLGLINSLATYRPDHWRKWLETHVTAAVVRVLGMRGLAAPRAQQGQHVFVLGLVGLGIVPEQLQAFLRRHRPCEQKSLSHGAAQPPQNFRLLIGFDSLGDDLDV